jgi:hypothetical protein
MLFNKETSRTTESSSTRSSNYENNLQQQRQSQDTNVSPASTDFTPNFADSTVFNASSPTTAANDAVTSVGSLQKYLLASGILLGTAAWDMHRQIVSQRTPSSVFAKASKAVSRPIALTPSGSILFSTPVAAPAWSPFAVPMLVPMFTPTNTAGVAFLRPIAYHHPVSPSTVARFLSFAPSPQAAMVVSFLAFVGYKNYQYYQQHQFFDDE